MVIRGNCINRHNIITRNKIGDNELKILKYFIMTLKIHISSEFDRRIFSHVIAYV